MTRSKINRNIKPYLLFASDGIYGLLTFVVAATLSWLILAQANFFYGFWHDHSGIEQTIEEFGPKNTHRKGFADTSRQQRIDLFSEINTAIHNQGAGLESITYRVAGQNIALLHQAEIIHLNDVALLIHRLLIAAACVFLVWVVLTYRKMKSAAGMPSIKRQVGSLALIFIIFAVLIFFVGATELFYWLHTIVFPENHQWFFYYQDSLMSTMMQAPTLFGWIGATWALMSLVGFVGLQVALVLIRRKISNY